MFKCSNVQMFKCSNVSMFQCFNVSMFQFSNFQMFQCYNVPLFQIFQCSNVPIFKCSNNKWKICRRGEACYFFWLAAGWRRILLVLSVSCFLSVNCLLWMIIYAWAKPSFLQIREIQSPQPQIRLMVIFEKYCSQIPNTDYGKFSSTRCLRVSNCIVLWYLDLGKLTEPIAELNC